MRLVQKHRESGAGATLLTAGMPDPAGYGRIVRDPTACHVLRIVEQKDASAGEQDICEINTGMYAFEARRLFAELGKVGRANAQGEFYLTDIVEVFRREGITVAAFETPDHRETLGVNSREQLADALAVLQERINKGWMESGVTIVSPSQTFIGPDASIGPDTVVWPGTILEGRTVVGARCRIGPNVRVEDSVVGDDACVEFAVVRQSQLGHGAQVGPYASLRPGSVMADRSKAGTFVELKNAQVGEDSKVPHLSYMGDAIIGSDVNIGAGSITCNYDGYDKSETVVEDGAFVGSDTMLIAPVRIGENAVIAAGSAIANDVPPDSLAIERAQQRNIEGWAKKRRDKKDQGG
jgi:bifunctional UDP-N-acetylglucosamine pyrophosphorylase/glucosamine-1-phosphate N-acetyltransferase